VSVAAVCRKTGMTRANYYARRKVRQRREVDGELVVALVCAERKLQPRLGTRKLRVLIQGSLATAGVKLGRDRLFEVLRAGGLLLEPQAAAYPCTTNSYHYLPVFKNQIKGLEITRPNEVWVSDFTFLRTSEGFMYLALVTDKYSRKIVGYHCAETLKAAGCILALEMALAGLSVGQRPMHHSDRGIQYCCHEYMNSLMARGLGISMTEQDHCAENALAERMNGILKSEYGLGRELTSKAQARQAVAQAVALYNTRRPHTALGYRFPEAVHSLAA
jgi:transposase InsO family protein